MQEKLRLREERLKAKLHRKTKNQSFRFREICLLPGQEFEAAGTLVLNGGRRTLIGGTEGWPFILSQHLGDRMDEQQRKKARSFTAWSAGSLILGLMFFFLGLQGLF